MITLSPLSPLRARSRASATPLYDVDVFAPLYDVGADPVVNAGTDRSVHPAFRSAATLNVAQITPNGASIVSDFTALVAFGAYVSNRAFTCGCLVQHGATSGVLPIGGDAYTRMLYDVDNTRFAYRSDGGSFFTTTILLTAGSLYPIVFGRDASGNFRIYVNKVLFSVVSTPTVAYDSDWMFGHRYDTPGYGSLVAQLKTPFLLLDTGPDSTLVDSMTDAMLAFSEV